MTTGIEWTDATWNPVTGCDKISAGCKFCYAETMAKRLQAMGQANYRDGFKLRLQPHMLTKPLSWAKPRRIFVNSMSDLFHKDVPFDFIAAVFGVMAACPQHAFQVLTKRPERMNHFLLEWARLPLKATRDEIASWFSKYSYTAASSVADSVLALRRAVPINVHCGTSIENQATADERIPHLLKCPVAVRFLSIEPLLGPIDLLALDGINWVIVGGESGPGARPCDPAWIRSIVESCQSTRTRVFVKQLGANPVGLKLKSTKGGDMAEWPEDLRIREMPPKQVTT